MQELLQELLKAHQAGQSVAYTSLVETRGSTPQKAGAAMLVFADGSQQGTLGGGCVEAEVKRRALRLLDEGEPEILTFHLDNNYGWDDGLICGGRMKMLVDPIRPDSDISYYQAFVELLAEGKGCTETVVLETEDDSLATDRMLLREGGEVVARTGSGALPAELTTDLKPLVRRPRPYVQKRISYLPYLKRCRLVIVGAGHVGREVADLAARADFDVWVVDDRADYCNPERFPQAERLVVGDLNSSLSNLEVDSDTYCIIVTRGHNHDEEALYHLAETGAGYVGLIGSKRKIKMIYADLLRDHISAEALRKTHSPLGFDIGSQTVPEIAISIVAELIAHRNLGELPPQYQRPHLLDEVQPQTTPTCPPE